MSGPFATATELAEFTGIPLPTDLSRWQQHLDAASALIRGFTHQTLSQVTADTVVLEAIERDTLILPERPVTAITTVVANGVTLSSTTDYHASTSDMLAGLLRRGTLVAKGPNWSYGATVTYTHGYASTTDEFADLRSLTLEIAARTLQGPSEGADFGNIFPEAVGNAPYPFLTQSEQWRLASLGAVLVG